MKKITKFELAMVLIALIVCGTGYGIWRIQALEDNLFQSTSVRMVEKKYRAPKPTNLPEKHEGFDVQGRIEVSIEE